MAVTAFRSVATDQYSDVAGTTTFTVTAPSGLTDGDVVMVSAFTPEITSTSMSISGSGWATIGTQNVITNAYPETVWIKIASGEGASWTVTCGGNRQSFCAVTVCWDGSLLNPAPVTPANTKVQTKTPALFANSSPSRWRTMICFDASGYLTSQATITAGGWTLLGDEFCYVSSSMGGNVSVWEKYCSSDFPSLTWTTSSGAANSITEQYSFVELTGFGTAGSQDHWGWTT